MCVMRGIVGLLALSVTSVTSAAGHYEYRLDKCGVNLFTNEKLIFEYEALDSPSPITSAICKGRFRVADARSTNSWAFIAVMEGDIPSSLVANPDLPWHSTENPNMFEFFQAGHPPQKLTMLPDGRQLLHTSYGVENCRFEKETGAMAMCDSEVGMISNEHRTLFIDLEGSEAKLSVLDLLKNSVLLGTRMNSH